MMPCPDKITYRMVYCPIVKAKADKLHELLLDNFV
jgi:hypothetical protein